MYEMYKKNIFIHRYDFWLALKGGTLERGMLERGMLERGTLERGMLFFTFSCHL